MSRGVTLASGLTALPGAVPPALPVFYPATLDTAGITAAAVAAAAIGGIVQLPGQTITLTGPLPLLAGVTYIGCGYNLSPAGGPVLTSGTILQGDGTFPCFSGNAADLGAPYGSSSALLGSWICCVEIAFIGIQNFSYGVKLGALYQGGTQYGYFHDLYIANCGQWGMWIENTAQSNFERISISFCGGAFAFIGSGQGLWNFGNSHFSKLVCSGNRNTSGRGIWIASRAGSALNNCNLFDIAAGGAITSNTQAATMVAPIATVITNAQANIAATNTYAAGDPVGFSVTVGTAGGQVLVGSIYYVSATGLSGAGFQVSATVGGAVITFNASGTPNVYTVKIGVTDLSQYGVGMPVKLSATANGFTGTQIYFVQAVSAASGAGTITLCNFMGGTGGSVPLAPTGSTAVNIITQGWPVLDVGGSDANSTVTFSSITGATDCELGGTAHIVLQALLGFTFDTGIIHVPTSTADICCRNMVAGQGIRINIQNTGVVTDFDSSCQKIQVFGSNTTPFAANFTGIGFTSDGTSGFGRLNLVGTSTPDFSANSNFFNQIQMGNCLALKFTQQPTAHTLVTADGNLISFQTAAGGTLTLPALTTNMVGWSYIISNPQANSVTVSSAAQNIVGLGASGLSITLLTLTTAHLIAMNNGGTMFWCRVA